MVLKIIIIDGSPLKLLKSVKPGVLVLARVMALQGDVQGCSGILIQIVLVLGRGACLSILMDLVRYNEVMSSLLLPQH